VSLAEECSAKDHPTGPGNFTLGEAEVIRDVYRAPRASISLTSSSAS
jgi:hypothetical protein